MKKLFAVLLTIAMILAMTACGGGNTPVSSGGAAPSSPEGAKQVTVGLIQLMEHPSLDEIRAAITARLEEKSAESGVSIQVNYQNAQGDTSTINTICQQFVAGKVDVIVAIATPAAQGAAAAAENSGIPVVFSAVTDPVAAGLVENLEAPEGNITGTSDAIPVEKIFALAKELTPEAQSFGLIYNTSEDNSLSVIAQVKGYLEGAGLSYTEGAVTTSADVQTSARNLLGKCDALFVPIDNTVASAMAVLADEAIQAKKPVYVAADSLVADGGLAAVGVNYTNLGSQTADMVLKIVTGTPVSQVPVEVLRDNNLVINGDTARAIGVDISQYGPNDATFVSSVA